MCFFQSFIIDTNCYGPGNWSISIIIIYIMIIKYKYFCWIWAYFYTVSRAATNRWYSAIRGETLYWKWFFERSVVRHLWVLAKVSRSKSHYPTLRAQVKKGKQTAEQVTWAHCRREQRGANLDGAKCYYNIYSNQLKVKTALLTWQLWSASAKAAQQSNLSSLAEGMWV